MEERDQSADGEPAAHRAVLDTSVFYPPYLRDTLLRAAEHGLYRPVWSGQIIEELRRNVSAISLTPTRVEYLIASMRRKFPRAEHSVPADLIEQMTNAPEDRHVAALAAIAADEIVTANLRDFPPSSLAPYGVNVQSPDQFLVSLLDANPERIKRIVAEQAAGSRLPQASHDSRRPAQSPCRSRANPRAATA
jgi:PIN domain